MYVYKRTEPQLFTVGFYDPKGQWHSESDWNDKDKAAQRVNWLNGGEEFQRKTMENTSRKITADSKNFYCADCNGSIVVTCENCNDE